MAGNFLFTSESVAEGHPDKIADQISDAILDACLTEDINSKVACEVLVAGGSVIIAGEITTSTHIDYQEIARETIRDIGYDDSSLGFDYRCCGVLLAIREQSSNIAQGVHESEGLFKDQGAGDQGLMFGYACDETPELMPMPIMYSHRIVNELSRLRKSKSLAYLRPDGKTQITIEYDEHHVPQRLHTVVISTQHAENISYETIYNDMKALVYRVIPNHLIDQKTLFYVNPTGLFIIGGPVADCGLTGRKIIVDTYGGMGRHGGGAFSGKDPSKVDRSGSYAARYIAKNIVAAKLARRCEVQISYAIGVSYPLSIKVDTFGTATISEVELAQMIPKIFNLSPKGIIEMLDLKRPIYKQTAFGGHFGRELKDFTWERTDRAISILHS